MEGETPARSRRRAERRLRKGRAQALSFEGSRRSAITASFDLCMILVRKVCNFSGSCIFVHDSDPKSLQLFGIMH
jgi:hypothetical protein